MLRERIIKISALHIYDRLILGKPVVTLLLVLLFTAFLGWFIQDLKIDISADSLVLENDEDLRYYRSIQARYGSDSYLIVTYTPRRRLFDKETLEVLRMLRDDLAAIERVESVITILDVPLVQSPPMGLSELQQRIRTLGDPDTDLKLAERELRESPLFRNRLIEEDGDTTALQVNFYRDQTYLRLRNSRDALREKRLEAELTPKEARELERLSDEFNRYSSEMMAQEAADIARIRSILDRYRDRAELHLGGVPMIAADMMDFIRHDIRVFGVAVIAILALLLIIAFRQPRWVILPLLTAFAASVMTLGLLGLGGWKITVVSSNFLALLLIFVLSLTIHLIVRYLELHIITPDAEQRYLVLETVRTKTVPCFYTVTTTMVAFASLVVSGIRPVIDFGWIMGISLTVAFLLAFTLFPAALMLLNPGTQQKKRDFTGVLTGLFPPLIERHGNLILGVATMAVGLGIIGLSRLTVENRFIDNFKESTEIYQGMYLIDRKLGGTTPLDVVIDAPADFLEKMSESADSEWDDDPWADQSNQENEAGITGTSYWFNSFMLDEVEAIHKYLDGIDETGKVLSLFSTLEVLKQINGGILPDDFTLAILYKRLPDRIKQSLFIPYVSADGNQLRYSIRIYESDPSLRRKALLEKINRHLTGELGLAPEQVHLTGMLVLYNNMLQSLFRSQILTLEAVFLAILLMFVVLFRSLWVALIAIVPNLIAVPLVLGLMGGFGIPLDIMTITIAAISIGIGVDNAIHYVHRFATELSVDGDYQGAVRRSHGSIGRAMYYTTISITVGFSILTLSQFIPTFHFGLLTAFAMVIALLANLTVLPVLLGKLRPYGKVKREQIGAP